MPNQTSYQFQSTNTGTADELILLRDNSFTFLPGIWYLGVLNADTNQVNYTIVATEFTLPFVDLTNDVSYCTMIASNGVDYYRLLVSSNALGADFETFAANGNVDLYVVMGIPPAPGPTNFFYASTNPGTNNEFITITNNAAPYPLVPGEWWAAVVHNDTQAVNYCIRAREHVGGPPPRQIITLTNSLLYSNIMGPNAADFYRFTVGNAVEAHFEAFQIEAGRELDLLVGQGNPIAGLTNVLCASTNAGSANEFIRAAVSNTPCVLTQGDWFLVVTNTQNNTNGYAVRATEYFPGRTELPILVRNVAMTNAVVARDPLLNLGFDYYQFTVSTGAYQAFFEVIKLSGDADLYLRSGLPFPGPGDADFQSTRPLNLDEVIVVATNSLPPLAPGPWYLTVSNKTAAPVDYVVRVTELGPGEVITLTNAVPYTNTVQVFDDTPAGGLQFYRFVVSTNNVIQANFELYGLDGNADLFVGKGLPFPTPTNYDGASTNLMTANELVMLYTNGVPVALEPGEWFITVRNRENYPVNCTVKATEIGAAELIVLTNGVAYVDTLTGDDNQGGTGTLYFQFTVDTTAVQADFQASSGDGDVDLYLRRGWPLPHPSSFTASSQNPGFAPEAIKLYTGGAPVPLSPGTYLLAVHNREVFPAKFTVCAFQVRLGNELITLTNGLPYTRPFNPADCLNPGAIQYYRYSVSSSAVRAQFEVLNPSVDVHLIAKRLLPLPTMLQHDGISTNAGLNDEQILLFTNSAPVQLSLGLWYLGVVNATTNPGDYTVRALEFNQWGTNFGYGGFLRSSNQLCFTWTNVLPGVLYFVSGSQSLSPAAWVPISPPIAPTNSSVTYCLTLPSDYHFFRLTEGLLLSQVFAIQTLSHTTNGFLVEWTAPPGNQFQVQWAPDVDSGRWRPFTNIISSTNNLYRFLDTGAQTGGLDPARFYRFLELP